MRRAGGSLRVFPFDEPEATMIGEGMSVVGTLLFDDGVMRLDGHMEGKIIGQGTLVIGEKGSLQGEVEVGTIVVGGLVEGIVSAKGSAHITSTGKFFGKILASELVIERGGILEGEGEARNLVREDLPPQTRAESSTTGGGPQAALTPSTPSGKNPSHPDK